MRARELDPDIESRIEHLAARCKHAALPCDACTNLSVWAVLTLDASGWRAQINRFQSRPRSTPKETPQ
jgi:hypothetical protein